jgi:hypothetical protein
MYYFGVISKRVQQTAMFCVLDFPLAVNQAHLQTVRLLPRGQYNGDEIT